MTRQFHEARRQAGHARNTLVSSISATRAQIPRIGAGRDSSSRAPAARRATVEFPIVPTIIAFAALGAAAWLPLTGIERRAARSVVIPAAGWTWRKTVRIGAAVLVEGVLAVLGKALSDPAEAGSDVPPDTPSDDTFRA